jgi:hypothetical protein
LESGDHPINEPKVDGKSKDKLINLNADLKTVSKFFSPRVEKNKAEQ